jgi:hypothetical protein
LQQELPPLWHRQPILRKANIRWYTTSFFGLKIQADRIIEGLKTLRKIETIKELRIGVVASTEKRDVVDNSWAVSELMFFEDTAGQATYQTHPIHQQFIKDCSHLWDKVIVYDAIDV